MRVKTRSRRSSMPLEDQAHGSLLNRQGDSPVWVIYVGLVMRLSLGGVGYHHLLSAQLSSWPVCRILSDGLNDPEWLVDLGSARRKTSRRSIERTGTRLTAQRIFKLTPLPDERGHQVGPSGGSPRSSTEKKRSGVSVRYGSSIPSSPPDHERLNLVQTCPG